MAADTFNLLTFSFATKFQCLVTLRFYIVAKIFIATKNLRSKSTAVFFAVITE